MDVMPYAGWTPGEWMFYGGFICFGIFAVTMIVVKAVLASRGEKLKKRFDDEYGPAVKQDEFH